MVLRITKNVSTAHNTVIRRQMTPKRSKPEQMPNIKNGLGILVAKKTRVSIVFNNARKATPGALRAP